MRMRICNTTGEVSAEAPEQPLAFLLPRSAAARHSGLGPLRHVIRTGSTNSDLIQEARCGFTDPCVLVADNQTAGRGRMGRHWNDPGTQTGAPGALLVSFRLPGAMADAPGRMAAVSASALSALADVGLPTGSAEAGQRHGAMVLCKWPNDLVIEFPATRGAVSPTDLEESGPDLRERQSCVGLGTVSSTDLEESGHLDDSGRCSPSRSGKLAGVLAEVVSDPVPVVVVGLGLNLSHVPDEPGAISLREVGVNASRDELLSCLLDIMPTYLANPSLARTVLHSASATIGRRVRVEQADGTAFTGTARDIDSQGRLLVDTSTGSRLVEAGDVHHIRIDSDRSDKVVDPVGMMPIGGQVSPLSR